MIYMKPPDMEKHLLEFIRRTSTEMPPDIEDSLKKGYRTEKPESPAKSALRMMLDSIELSRQKSEPLCQDTGAHIWHINYPDGTPLLPVTKAIEKATAKATDKSYLRPNAVDPVTGKNSGTNLGDAAPNLYFHPWNKKSWEFSLLMKGGGCENVGAQYRLPDFALGADRDLDGVYKVVLDGVWKAQGRGCAPGIICICIGGNRDSGMSMAKKQSFRKLDDVNPVPELGRLEKRLMRDINKLGIGPMGFGGKTTALGVKIATLHRLPACYFVSISYLCWSARRGFMKISGDRVTYSN
jgi:fumarate hydratase class I